MKELAVVITTHISDPETTMHRHANWSSLHSMDNILYRYFKDICIGNYRKFDSGLADGDWDIIIVDTGSPLEEYHKWANEQDDLHIVGVPNASGAWAGMRTMMFSMPWISHNYNYFLFHVDDGVEPIGDLWATDMIAEYDSHDPCGIMGRKVETICLGPAGLRDHRRICGHIADIWGITEDTDITHIHGDYLMMDSETLRQLASEWYNPMHSEKAMNYQIQLENMDFAELFKMAFKQDGSQKEFEDMHIGREVDIPLRIESLGKKLIEYSNKGELFRASQLHHRVQETLNVLHAMTVAND